MKNFTKVLVIGAVAALSLNSCHDTDVFDVNNKISALKENFTKEENFGEIAADQDFNMSEAFTVKVSSSIAGTVKIYTSMPTSEGATYLTSGSISKGETKEFSTMRSVSDTIFYVTLFDSEGAAIVKTVTETGETVTFGDASATRAVGNTKNLMAKRSIKSLEYGDDASDSEYATSVPDDADEVSNYGNKQSGNYYVSTSTTEVNAWNGNCDIYIPEGNYNFTKFYVGGNTNVYLLPGANVTFSVLLDINHVENCMYVAEGATINADNGISYNFKLYNRGTIKTNSVSCYSAGFLYNSGTLTVYGDASVENGGAQMVNAGTMTAYNLYERGSGSFKNVSGGTVDIYEKTIINSLYAGWENDGYFETKEFTYSAGSGNVINRCKLVCDKFTIALGEGDKYSKCFLLDAGASIECKYYYHGIGYMLMGSKSVINVKMQAVMGVTKSPYGIYGEGDGYAVFCAKYIDKGIVSEYWYNIYDESVSQGYQITYGGKLVVATNQHFAQGYSGAYPYYDVTDENTVKLFLKGMDTASGYGISSSDCNVGYSPKESSSSDSGSSSSGSGSSSDSGSSSGSGSSSDSGSSSSSYNKLTDADGDTPQIFTLAFEDLGSINDFDYNDVVLYVTNVNSEGKARMKPMGMGGQFDVDVYYGDTKLFSKTNGEITNTRETKDWVDYDIVEFDAGDAVDFTKFKLHVTNTTYNYSYDLYSTTTKGDAPVCIIVGKAWLWPTEKTSIGEAYPDFKSYCGDASQTSWCDNPQSGYVYEKGKY